jgi:hypothetical protein
MTKRTGRFLMILVAVAVPLTVLMAPSAAPAKTQKRVKIYFEGPINHSKDPGYTPLTHDCCFPSYTPTIQIQAKTGGTKPTKIEVTQYGLWGPCSGSEYSDGESKDEITFKPKKISTPFSGSHTGPINNTVTVTGRILGKRTASGTVREVEVRQNMGPGYAWGTCDSGTVTWTASRVKQLTDLKASFNPNLIYPAGL